MRLRKDSESYGSRGRLALTTYFQPPGRRKILLGEVENAMFQGIIWP
jgi:hypothetical protein